MTGLILRPRHVRAANLCMRGGRAYAAQHGIDWNRFVNEGLPVDDMPKELREDPLMARAIAEAEKEQHGQER